MNLKDSNIQERTAPDLKARPFFLTEEQIQWVHTTLNSMTLEEKAGQVFCPMGFAGDEDTLRHTVCEIGAGGMMYRPGPKADIQEDRKSVV